VVWAATVFLGVVCLVGLCALLVALIPPRARPAEVAASEEAPPPEGPQGLLRAGLPGSAPAEPTRLARIDPARINDAQRSRLGLRPPEDASPIRVSPRLSAGPGEAKAGLAPINNAAPPIRVSFMGTEAKAQRACFIADCSGSMRKNNRLGLLKRELEKTLRGLGPEAMFYVIFFHSKEVPMPAKTWLRGGKDVESVLPWIQERRTSGGTRPLSAFEHAFRLDPRPDVIFFLTDGEIPSNVPSEVAKLNDKPGGKVRINTILLGAEKSTRLTRVLSKPGVAEKTTSRVIRGDLLLRRLANESGGTYRFVPDKDAPAKD
jgi:hypothetical protein